MINANAAFHQKLASDERNYLEYADITLRDGTILNLTNENIWSSGFSIEDAVSQDDVLQVGCAIINKATLVINNIYDDYSAYDFTGANIVLSVGLDVGTEEDPDIISLTKGTYVEYETKYNGSLITISMYDYMSKFDKTYVTELQYPLRLIDILEDICENESVDVELATTTFPNMTTSIPVAPEKTTFREVVSWIATMAGCYARCNRLGQLELKWFNTDVFEDNDSVEGGEFDNSTPYSSGDEYDGGTFNPWSTGDVLDAGDFESNNAIHHITQRYAGDMAVDDVVITGVKVIVKSQDDTGESINEYIAGTEGYTIKVSDNDFITDDNAQYFANYLGSMLVGVRFRIIDISHPSDPTIEAGDVALYFDLKGNAYNVLVTKTTFTVGEPQNTACGAETPARNSAERFAENTKIYVELRKKIADGLATAEELIEELQSQVSEMTVGGTNLLRNTQDYLYTESFEDYGCLYTQNCLLSGKYKDCIIAQYDNTESSSVADMLVWREITVELGKTYTLSFWAMSDDPQEPTMYAYFYGASGYPTVAKGVSSEGTENTNSDGLMPFDLDSDWQRYWVKWTISDTGNIEIPKWVLIRAAANASVKIAGVKLEEGSSNSYYSPSPYDVNDEIDSIKTLSRYGTCETSSDTIEKEVTMRNFALYEGAQVSVMFVNGNDTESMMMDINGTGSKLVMANNGDIVSGKLNFPSGTTASFVYDGTVYRFLDSDNLYNMIQWTEETGLTIRAKEGSLNRVNINNESVDVYDENGNLGTSTNSEGFSVYNEGTRIAKFGERTIIGEVNNGSRIELDRSAIEFYEDTTRTAYLAEDKFFFINGEVSQAFFFPKYAVRQDLDEQLVITKR